jgi:hypothetical protein
LLTGVRRWELIDNWFYTLRDGTKIVIPRGFVFDGASTPKFVWGILDPVGVLLIQGLVHDFGYRYNYLWALPEGSTRPYKYMLGAGKKFYDNLFKEVGQDVNGMMITGWVSWVMLKLFGQRAWEANRELNDFDIIPTISWQDL